MITQLKNKNYKYFLFFSLDSGTFLFLLLFLFFPFWSMEDSSSRKRKNCVEDEEEEEEEECLLTGFVTKRGRLAEEEAEEADSSLLPQKTLSPDVMNKRLAFLYGAKNRRGMAIVELRLRVKQAIIPFAESLNGFAQDPTILMHLVRNASTPYTPSDLAEFLPYLVKHRDFTARSGG